MFTNVFFNFCQVFYVFDVFILFWTFLHLWRILAGSINLLLYGISKARLHSQTDKEITHTANCCRQQQIKEFLNLLVFADIRGSLLAYLRRSVTDCGHVSVCLSFCLSRLISLRRGDVVATSWQRPVDVLPTSWRRYSDVQPRRGDVVATSQPGCTPENRWSTTQKNRRVGDGGEPSTFSAVDGREKHLARSTEIDIRRPPADSNAPFTHTRRVAARCFAALLKTLRVFY